jgi:nickel/cobalt transporter (NicO) family protein
MFVRARLIVIAIVMRLALPSVADAHRLDEYLQATRIDVSLDRVELDIDLTAGVGVAPDVWGLIDADRNGRISDAEGRSYADVVLKSLVLQIDGHPRPVALVSSRFPTFQEIASGSGPIRLEARAELPPTTAGRHTLRYKNTHRRATSVYLVNTLVPSTSAITIASQRRDPRQTELVLTYDVAARSP